MKNHNYNSEPNPFHLKPGIYAARLHSVAPDDGELRFVFSTDCGGMAALNLESMNEVRDFIRAWFPGPIPGFSRADDITTMAHLHSFIAMIAEIEVVTQKYSGKKVKFRYICDIGPVGTLTAKKKAERKALREQERLENQKLAIA